MNYFFFPLTKNMIDATNQQLGDVTNTTSINYYSSQRVLVIRRGHIFREEGTS